MVESWDEDAYARVTATCMHVRITQLQQDFLLSNSTHNNSSSTLSEDMKCDIVELSSSFLHKET